MQLMNVALIGHRGAGKTTLAEHFLAAGRAVRQPGSIPAGTTLFDHREDEKRQQASLQTSFGWFEHEDLFIHLIDVPGGHAFAYQTELAIAMADVAIVVVDAGHPLGVGGERAIRSATRNGLPILVFVNHIDRPHDLPTVLEDVRRASIKPVVPTEVVLTESGTCTAVVDLTNREIHGRTSGHAFDDLQSWSTHDHERLCEAVAVTDDALLEQYLETMVLNDTELVAGLRRAFSDGMLVPCLFGAAADGFGVERLLSFLHRFGGDITRAPMATEYDGTPVRIRPTDSRFIAQLVCTQLDENQTPFQVLRVWSGTAPLNKVWINCDTGASAKVRKLYRIRGKRRATAKARGAGHLVATWDLVPGRPGATFTLDERLVIPPPDKPARMVAHAIHAVNEKAARSLPAALELVQQLDPALEVHHEPLTDETILWGASESELTTVERTLSSMGAEVRATLPAIPYCEMPVRAVERVEGLHRREDADGLAVEFGCCQVGLSPSMDQRVSFEDVFDDVEELPSKFRPAIDAGVKAALKHGPLAGYPVLGARIELTGGTYDILQSTAEHFELAGELAARQALEQATTHLLEPWWTVDVYAPSKNVGSIISELSSRRGRVVGLEVVGEETKVCAHVPYRELRTLGPSLDSVCAGRGRFLGELSHYERAPDQHVEEAVASSPFGALARSLRAGL